MFRRLLNTYPKYTVYSSQYRSCTNNKTPTWGEVTKKDTGLDITEYGFKREIVPSDFEYEKPKDKDKPKDKIWEGWIP